MPRASASPFAIAFMAGAAGSAMPMRRCFRCRQRTAVGLFIYKVACWSRVSGAAPCFAARLVHRGLLIAKCRQFSSRARACGGVKRHEQECHRTADFVPHPSSVQRRCRREHAKVDSTSRGRENAPASARKARARGKPAVPSWATPSFALFSSERQLVLCLQRSHGSVFRRMHHP